MYFYFWIKISFLYYYLLVARNKTNNYYNKILIIHIRKKKKIENLYYQYILKIIYCLCMHACTKL